MKLVAFALCVAFATFCDVSGAAVARQDPTIAPTQRPGTPKTIIGPKGFVGAATFGPSGFKYDENPPLEEWNVINPDGSFRYGYKNVNGIQVAVDGHQEGIARACCDCQNGTVMRGQYSFVPLESNESGDEEVIDPKVRYTITWKADETGFNSVVSTAKDTTEYKPDEEPPYYVVENGPNANGDFNFAFENPNRIKVSASGNLIYTEKNCCLCGVGTVMKGAYSYVPLDSNESGDEYPLLHPKVRYVVHWTADTDGFQPVIEEQALSDYTYEEDELVYG